MLDGTRFAWKVKFTIQRTGAGKQGQSLIVSVPIIGYSGNSAAHRAAQRTGLTDKVPDEHQGATLTPQVRLNWASRIMERWGGGTFVVKDTAGDELETYDIGFELKWVDNPSQAAQVVFAVKTTGNAPPDGTVNTMYWGVDDGGTKGAAIARVRPLDREPRRVRQLHVQGQAQQARLDLAAALLARLDFAADLAANDHRWPSPRPVAGVLLTRPRTPLAAPRRLTGNATHSLIPAIRPWRERFALAWNEVAPGPRGAHDARTRSEVMFALAP